MILHRASKSSAKLLVFKVFVLLILFHCNCTQNGVNGETCDACQFDGNDTDDCKDYGMIDDELVAWHLGSQDCMNEFSIQISSVDPTLICASSNSFVNDLRLGSLASSTAKLGLGVSEMDGGFFRQDEVNNNAIVIKGNITIDGTTYDCAASESSCYNAMKAYFQKDPNGKKEMKDVCDTLFNTVKTDRQMEQSILRIRMCTEFRADSYIPSVCEPLGAQVEQKMSEYPTKDCSGFGFGTQNTTIPGCNGSGRSVGTDSPTTSSSGAIVPMVAPAIFMMAALVMQMN